jgi:hypothetical protein
MLKTGDLVTLDESFVGTGGIFMWPTSMMSISYGTSMRPIDSYPVFRLGDLGIVLRIEDHNIFVGRRIVEISSSCGEIGWVFEEDLKKI